MTEEKPKPRGRKPTAKSVEPTEARPVEDVEAIVDPPDYSPVYKHIDTSHLGYMTGHLDMSEQGGAHSLLSGVSVVFKEIEDNRESDEDD